MPLQVVTAGWNTDALYETWAGDSLVECNRVLRRLVLDGFLWEELVVTRDGAAACAYVKPGNMAAKALLENIV